MENSLKVQIQVLLSLPMTDLCTARAFEQTFGGRPEGWICRLVLSCRRLLLTITGVLPHKTQEECIPVNMLMSMLPIYQGTQQSLFLEQSIAFKTTPAVKYCRTLFLD